MPDQPNPTPSHDDLVARLNLIEAIISEGRATTGRYGWMFVMWGLLYCLAMMWGAFFPYKNWAWGVSITIGVVLSGTIKRRQRRAGINLPTPRSHSIEAVWKSMGAAVTLFSIACAFSHAITQPMYFSAVLFMVGLAHATSAIILRWAAQGLACAVWWLAGIAALFYTTPQQLFLIFMLATIVGMVSFGVYAMLRENRRTPPASTANAHA